MISPEMPQDWEPNYIAEHKSWINHKATKKLPQSLLFF